MELTRLLIGLPNVIIFSGPVHARLLYVFWTRPDFYKRQCYRIMTQMEILTCLLLPYYFFMGCSILLQHQLFGITINLANVAACITLCLNTMDLVLALNRVKVIFSLNYPSAFDHALQACVWLLGLGSVAIQFSPYAGFTFTDDILGAEPDMSLAWVDAYSIIINFTLASTVVIVVCYVAIVAKLVYEKLQTGYVGRNSYEKQILLNAVIRFLGDFLAQMCFKVTFLVEGWGGSPRLVQIFSQLADFLSMFNYTCVAPVLYMVLNRNIRAAVVNKKTTVNVIPASL
ncbi:hypothetical protein L596_026524 [Steinernema carpocapsae]|uniref:7TM GPCR serpentine receptor class x (Srx) domain-containing protein n=1 Tax=Steinernema carpocapsae TaxID=34508 RepID=A0A4U5M1P7_STECR|nr:hypothetical protein L596_026524 [Steinernema carpocapsae]